MCLAISLPKQTTGILVSSRLICAAHFPVAPSNDLSLLKLPTNSFSTQRLSSNFLTKVTALVLLVSLQMALTSIATIASKATSSTNALHSLHFFEALCSLICWPATVSLHNLLYSPTLSLQPLSSSFILRAEILAPTHKPFMVLPVLLSQFGTAQKLLEMSLLFMMLLSIAALPWH